MKEIITKLAAYLQKQSGEYIGNDGFYTLTISRIKRRITAINAAIKDTQRGHGDTYLFDVWMYYNAPELRYSQSKEVILAAYDIERKRLAELL